MVFSNKNLKNKQLMILCSTIQGEIKILRCQKKGFGFQNKAFFWQLFFKNFCSLF